MSFWNMTSEIVLEDNKNDGSQSFFLPKELPSGSDYYFELRRGRYLSLGKSEMFTIVDTEGNPEGDDVSITVTSPTAGSIFKAGDKVTVKWKSTSLSKSTYIYVGLMKGGGKITHEQDANNNNDKSLNFSLPKYLISGSDYYFKVYVPNEVMPLGVSEKFQIEGDDPIPELEIKKIKLDAVKAKSGYLDKNYYACGVTSTGNPVTCHNDIWIEAAPAHLNLNITYNAILKGSHGVAIDLIRAVSIVDSNGKSIALPSDSVFFPEGRITQFNGLEKVETGFKAGFWPICYTNCKVEIGILTLDGIEGPVKVVFNKDLYKKSDGTEWGVATGKLESNTVKTDVLTMEESVEPRNNVASVLEGVRKILDSLSVILGM